MFKAMSKHYPDVKFESYHVLHDGSVRKGVRCRDSKIF